MPKSSLQGPLSQETDPVVLEDSTTRVLLKGLQVPMVTGVVCAIRGKVNAISFFHLQMDRNGDFEVNDTCFLHGSVVIPPMEEEKKSSPKDSYLCCVSGMNINETVSLRCHLLFEFIASQLGFVEDAKFASHIARVLLLGNSVAMPRIPFQRIRQDNKEIARSLQCVENLDVLLTQVLPSVPLTIVPGATDPTSILLPQQPLHPSLLLRSTRYSSLECATNPYSATIDGKTFLMTSGQNVQDILRQVAPSVSVIEAMALTLQWGALFPTDPNTCRRRWRGG